MVGQRAGFRKVGKFGKLGFLSNSKAYWIGAREEKRMGGRDSH
jgi:hypothetical protein